MNLSDHRAVSMLIHLNFERSKQGSKTNIGSPKWSRDMTLQLLKAT